MLIRGDVVELWDCVHDKDLATRVYLLDAQIFATTTVLVYIHLIHPPVSHHPSLRLAGRTSRSPQKDRVAGDGKPGFESGHLIYDLAVCCPNGRMVYDQSGVCKS